ncbi:MAG: bifunctional (p)ppGpp synthetase/guanosine-3',5'-bis(diphosphate) 3'-pyrophosphohydrolase [Paludibacteraceae bacterium]|nr:bifunctional (p)ppGpp synthetase/guanosine-3',5'-bis(diphosphate) 3'-pyrophosphohydrolase [Paludibacteraceae bacterium]
MVRLSLYRDFRSATAEWMDAGVLHGLQAVYRASRERTAAWNNLTEKTLETAVIANREMFCGRSDTCALLLHEFRYRQLPDPEKLPMHPSRECLDFMDDLERIDTFYRKTADISSENFRKLLLTMARDVRVILLLMAERLYYMRHIDGFAPARRLLLARETAGLYAPMAHRLGLYGIKTELENRSMQVLEPEPYRLIEDKLHATAEERQTYINHFVEPLQTKLDAAGFHYHLKSRTKAIYSIWNKMKKQNVPFEGVYDLLAIRIILDCPPEQEKAVCWQVYSIVTDMYTPDVRRMRDWLTVPKANGYESLHTTVMGPDGKWVEVQIRTVRMDEIAEKGVAAHWKYKGVQGEAKMDEWLGNLRTALENRSGDLDSIDEFKLNLYDEEVFVFTPAGDLFKLPKGATLLDFAFAIHTAVGSHCTGGLKGGRNITLRYELHNGDQIQVLTSPTQHPRKDWLSIAVTSKARQKIRQVIKENETKEAEAGRELLARRFKNWKLEWDEGRISHTLPAIGYKRLTDFFIAVARDEIDLLGFRDKYTEQDNTKHTESPGDQSTANYTDRRAGKDDVLVISNGTKGVQYQLAKCCHPIYGDPIFGFVTVGSGIKIHRCDCPNAVEMRARYGYRIVKAKWEVQGDQGNICPIYVKGGDNMGILTNITSVIAKESQVTLRSVQVDTDSGFFQGRLVLNIAGTGTLESLIRKLRAVKGVVEVSRG